MRSLVLLTVVASVFADTRFGASTSNQEKLCHDLLDEFYDPALLKTTTETCVRDTKGAQRLLDDLKTTPTGGDRVHGDPAPASPFQPAPGAPLQPAPARPAIQPLPRPTTQQRNQTRDGSTSFNASTQQSGAPHDHQNEYDPAEDLERAGFVQEAKGVRECVAKSQGDVTTSPTGGSSFNVTGFKNKIRAKVNGTTSEVAVERGLSNCPTRPLELYDAHEFVHCLEDHCSGKRQ